MKKYLIIILLFSCNNIDNKPFTTEKNNSDNNDSLQQLLLGNWGGETGNPVWGIRRDSIYYFSEKKSYSYSIRNNDMIVQYKEGPFILSNIHVVLNTLYFTMNPGVLVKAFRKK